MNIIENSNLNEKGFCPDCEWEGDITLCNIEEEQDTWETPLYEIAECPQCGEWNVESEPAIKGAH